MNYLLGGGGPVRPNLPPHLMDEGERAAGLVEKATSDILLAVDWAMNMEVVDALNRSSEQAVKREIIRQIRKRLQHRSTRVVHMALELIETVVKNCGPSVHKEVATPKFMATMARVARTYSERTGKENLQVADKAMDLIQSWGEAFLPMAHQLPLFSQTYHQLRREGLTFRTQYDETKVPIMTPPPTAPTHRGSGEFAFEGALEGESPGRVADQQGGESLLKMVENSESMLQDILYSIESSKELGSGNEVLHAVVGQCAKLSRACQESIEAKVLSGAEDVEVYLAANDQLQAALQLYEGMKAGTVALPLPQDRRPPGAVGQGEERELMSFDDDFLTGLGSEISGKDSKLSANEMQKKGDEAGGGKQASVPSVSPMLPPSRRDSISRSRRGSRGSAGSRGAGDDLLDLSNLDLASTANTGGRGEGGAQLGLETAVGPSPHDRDPWRATPPQIAPASQTLTASASMQAADPFASGGPLPILPPPRSLGSPPTQASTNASGSLAANGRDNTITDMHSQIPLTTLTPQPSLLVAGGSVGMQTTGMTGGWDEGELKGSNPSGAPHRMSLLSSSMNAQAVPSSHTSTGGFTSLGSSQSGGVTGGFVSGEGSMEHQTPFQPVKPQSQQQKQNGKGQDFSDWLPQPQQQQQLQWPPVVQQQTMQQGQRVVSTGLSTTQQHDRQQQQQQENPFDAFM